MVAKATNSTKDSLVSGIFKVLRGANPEKEFKRLRKQTLKEISGLRNKNIFNSADSLATNYSDQDFQGDSSSLNVLGKVKDINIFVVHELGNVKRVTSDSTLKKTSMVFYKKGNTYYLAFKDKTKAPLFEHNDLYRYIKKYSASSSLLKMGVGIQFGNKLEIPSNSYNPKIERLKAEWKRLKNVVKKSDKGVLMIDRDLADFESLKQDSSVNLLVIDESGSVSKVSQAELYEANSLILFNQGTEYRKVMPSDQDEESITPDNLSQYILNIKGWQIAKNVPL